MNTFYNNLKFTSLLLLSILIIFGVPVLGYAEIAPVSDRTPQVRDAIVAAVPGVNSADEVTETHLAAITSLNLRSTGIAELKSGDFSGMIGLTSLNLYNNELSILPDGIFEGLTALTSIRLGGNTVDPMPISVSLEKIEDGQFKAVVPIGAPFDIVVPISASNGSIADSATSLTITKGSTESSAGTVSRTADTTVAVTANIGTLPGLPRNHYGYVLTKSDALPLEVISAVTTTPPPVEPPPVEPPPVEPPPVEPPPIEPPPVEPPPVEPPPVEPPPVEPPPVEPEPETPTNTAPVFTDGSTAIRSIAENTAAGANIGTVVFATDANEGDTLTYALGGVDAVSFDIEQTTGQLKTKAALDYETKRVYSVTISVSDGILTDTITVIISVIDVDDMPFVSTTLAVSDRTPAVRDAIVTAIPSVSSANEVTDAHLATITTLNLRSTGISELKSGDFSGMTGLTNLNLYGNMLTTLPIGIFEGLTSMTSLRLGGNFVDPLPLIVSLQQIDAGEFQAVVHTGAPFDIVLPIGAMMVTIPKGSLTSESFTDASTPSIGALPGLPANNFGYTLAKSSVYNRTPQVRDAIFAALSDVNDYRNVTEVDLATITALNLDGKSITSLKAGDFAGMLSLTTLNLDNNQLTSLPGSIFGGLPSLTTLHLSNNQLTNLPDGFFTGIASLNELNVSGNSVSPLQLTVSLQKVGENQIKAVAPAGAPFDIVLPITVANGSIDGTTLTISTSSVESGALTVTRTPDTIAAVTVDIAMLPNLPSLHSGYALAKSNTGPLNIFSEINVAPVFTEGTTTTRTIAENTAADTNIGSAVSATDANNDTLTYSLSETDATSFSIVSTSGQLKTKATLDYETKTSYSVTVTVSDGGLTDTISVTINVTDVDENRAPVFTEGSSATRTVAENTGSGVDIGTTASATDADNDTLSYSLGGTDAAAFSIDSSSGQLQTKSALDYETKSSYSVIVTVSDGELTDSITVTITVTDIDEDVPVDNVVGTKDDETPNNAPVFTEGSSASREVAENTGSGVNIGSAVSATDADEDTLTYSLGENTDADEFSIDSSSGQLKTSATLDYETKDSYSVTITVSDGKGGSDSIFVTINITNIDESAPNNAPVFSDGAGTTRTVAENTGSGVDIGSAVSATDADEDTLTYSLGGTDASSFSINSTNGQLRTNAALDYETKSSYSVSITVSDGYNGSDTITVTITVTDVEERLANNAPVFTDGSSTTRSVAENTGSGVNIGDAISATDADADTLTYSLGGTDASSFSINSTNGQLRTNASLDYETKSSYSVSITVSDGYNGSDTITVTITITDVEERLANNAPVFTDGSSTTRSVAENTGSGVNIGDAISATDADADTLTYSLGGTDSSAFSINSTNGQLQTNASLDYETKSSYSVSITVSDGYNGSDTITVTITVADVDETPANNAPVFSETSPATRSIAENTTSDVNIGSAVSATDADNDTLTYGLTGTDASVFSIDNSNGQLQTSNSLDYETKSSYSVTVTVSDVNGGSDSIVVTINVTDVNEAPVFSDGTTTRTIAENVGANINIGTAVKATDPDTDDSLTYTLGGTDAASFAIDDKTGQLKTKSALDYETKTSYTVTVSVSDGSLENEITVTINVKNLDETPSNIPPVFTEGDDATRTIAENTAADTSIGTPIAATDADSETLAYVLSGTEASSFSIDDETGQLKTSGALNYETKSSYTVTVIVSDGSQNDTITVTINVTNVNDAPVFAATNDTALTIAENTAAGTNIGTAFAATDEDNDALTFSLGGEDAASFDIGSGSGQLKTKDALDYESNKNAYSVTVTASDGTLSDTISVTITVTDVDENSAPVFTEGETTTREVLENTGSGLDIGEEVEATDADINDTLEYTLGGTDADLFGIGSTDGQLRTKSALDYEDETSYSVTITASDGKKSDSIDVTINVTDVDENRAPVFATESTTRSVDENTGTGVDFGAKVEATDADINDTLEYTLGGTDNASFSIDSTNGQLRTDAALDYEMKSSYLVSVTVTDGNGGSDTISVTINVTDVDENRAPVFTDGTATERAIAENTGSGVDIGDPVGATDADDDDTLEYSLGGTDNASFSIDSTNGQLRTDAALDYETKSSYSVSVTVTDGNGGSDTITVTINVSDVDENRAPTFTDGTSTSRSIDENTATSVNIGSPVSAIDLDTDTLVYSLGGTDAASFDIDTGSGQLKTKAALDHETKSRYTVTVSVSDGNNGNDSITVAITVSDVNEAPVFAAENTTRSVDENTASGEHIGTPVEATDADTNDTLTYTLGGTDAVSFDIDTGSGQLKTKDALDHETQSSYTVTVAVSDGNNGNDSITVAITVSDVNEAPVFAAENTTRSVDENTASGQNIGTPVGATDADTGDILTYTLGGTDAASFDIVSTSGQLQTDAALDYETKTSYTVTVTVTDDSGVSNASATITVTINITDVVEGTSITPVSDRTQQVQDAIVEAVPGVSSAADVTAAHLATINDLSIDISMRNGPSSLLVGDFDGLTGLINLTIEDDYDVETLPSGIFDDLTSLTMLSIESTILNTLPSDIFDNLSSLTELILHDNELTSLPSGIFDNLTSLTTLNLSYNSFTSIPSGIFVNLTSLTDLDLEGNEFDPLTLPVSLELVQSGEFKAVAATGAPFDIVLPITVTNGTISGGATSVTISKGSVESSSLTVTQNSGSTGSVNASIGTLPDIPSGHYGYELSKGETLSVISGDNSAPVFNETGTVTRTIDEGDTPDRDIGNPVTATDADNEKLTYTLGGTDAASFSIDDETGQLKTKAALDYETKSSYTVTVTATDTSGASNNSATITVTITVNNLVEDTSFTPVSERTPWVRGAIVAKVPGVDSAEDVTAAHLSEIDWIIQSESQEGLPSPKPGDFDGLTGLRYLDLRSNDFTSLPFGIFDELTALTFLDLSDNGLSSLPSGIFDNLTALTTLNLNSNKLTSLPSGIFDELTALTKLELGGNELTSLLSGIFDNLTALTHLELDGNKFTSLPSGIFDELTALAHLELDRNEFTSLLSGIFDNLTALTHLELDGNKFTSLPSGIFDELTALAHLELDGNKFTSLPSGIFDNLTALTWLNVADNGLSSLTDGIFDQLTQLTDLYMGTNKLSSVPSGIFDQLSSLTILRLDNNHFSSLPDGIFIGLTSLDTFFIREQTDSNGNAVPALSLSLELEKVADGMFKAVAPAGAPYNIKIYLTLKDGVISGGQDYITIPKGSVESDTATVTRSPSDSTNVVNVSIDRVNEPPNIHDGYSVSYDNTQVLAVIPAVNGAPNSTVEIPDVTNLLPNYPNPFNPETWIPYQLSKSADVTFTIYNMRGIVVRELALGHKSAGYYTSKNRAAYWNGRNNLGEKVAAGMYFSTLKAGDYTATRKMLIRK